MDISRTSHISININDDAILIIGGTTGIDYSLRTLKNGFLYIPSKNKFIKSKNMNYERGSINSLLLKNGNCIIYGGTKDFFSKSLARPEYIIIKK